MLRGRRRTDRFSQSGGATIGANFHYAAAGTGTNKIAWQKSVLPASGRYRIYARWSEYTDRATDAKWTVTHDGGSTTVTVNQQVNGGLWIPLGVYDLSTGTGDLVALTDDADGTVTADAVKFVKAEDGSRVFADAIKIVPNTAEDALYVHTDHLAKPQKMTDPDGYVVWDAAYRPFGEEDGISGTETNNLRFPGQYADIESALAYNWHRYYDPTLGRYVQSDPIGLRGGLNTYGYVGGSPVIFTDPDGRILPFLAAIGGACAVGGVAGAFGSVLGKTLGDLIDFSKKFPPPGQVPNQTNECPSAKENDARDPEDLLRSAVAGGTFGCAAGVIALLGGKPVGTTALLAGIAEGYFGILEGLAPH